MSLAHFKRNHHYIQKKWQKKSKTLLRYCPQLLKEISGVDISKLLSKAMKLTPKNVMKKKGKQRLYKQRKT
jgi:hypothetical protein